MNPALSSVTPAESRLVLSLFPGVGLLDRGFEAAGFCVVRGPDLLLGQRIENFHAPASHFSGVIGGPPCQDFSRARRRPPTGVGKKMILEFARVVTEAGPDWWLMENVPGVPDVHIPGYSVQRFNLYAVEFGSTQMRNRAFQFGSRSGEQLCIGRGTQSHPGRRAKTVCAKDGRMNFTRLKKLQGLPADFDLPGLSRTAKIRAVGNGVPLCMAAAVATAIRDRGVTARWLRVCGLNLCACRCGRLIDGRQVTATPACRKRIERSRRGLTPGRVTFPGTLTAALLPGGGPSRAAVGGG